MLPDMRRSPVCRRPLFVLTVEIRLLVLIELPPPWLSPSFVAHVGIVLDKKVGEMSMWKALVAIRRIGFGKRSP